MIKLMGCIYRIECCIIKKRMDDGLYNNLNEFWKNYIEISLELSCNYLSILLVKKLL